MTELQAGDRITFTYGKGATGFGVITKVFKRKVPKIKFDKQVPPGLSFDELKDIKVLKHKV